MTSPAGPARGFRIAANIAGFVLLLAAVFVVFRNREELAGAWSSVRAAPAWMLAAVVLLPLVNWVLTSAIFWTLIRRHGRVGPWEMAALIGSAWILNMLPFKPGFVGRVAYHKAISGIPIRTTLLVTLIALVSGGIGVLIAVSAQIATDASLRSAVPMDRLLPIALCFVGTAAVPVVILWMRKGAAAVGAHFGDFAIAVALRIADTHIWALRYFLAFRLLGNEQAYGMCVLVSGVSQLAGQAPIQLGLREWMVGESTSVLRGGTGMSGAAAAPGIAVDLVCRGAEVACALPVGLISFAWVHRRLARVRAAEGAGELGETGGAGTDGSGKLTPPSGRMKD